MANYITDRKYTDYIHQNVAVPTLYSKLGWKELTVDSKDLEGLDIDFGTDYVFTKDGLLMTVQERFREKKYSNYTDFTIRYRRDGNYHKDRQESEYYKITAQYFTYGITNCLKSELSICTQFQKVAIVNLEKLFDKIDNGEIIIQDNHKYRCEIIGGKLICPIIYNKDNSSSFVPFDIPSLVQLWGEEMILYSRGFGNDIDIKEERKTINIIPLRIYDASEVRHPLRYTSYLPLYSIRAACGYFGEGEEVSESGWMQVEGIGRLNQDMFIVQATGNSMEPRIHDGDYCVFEKYKGGSRNGKIVLAQHRGYYDDDNAGAFSIKEYNSTKSADEYGNWQHESIELRPLNPAYNPIVLTPDDIEDFKIIGEFVATL